MDYVVAGFGIGAVLALIGFALWEIYGDVEEPGTSWLSRAAIGLMLGALVIWSITVVSLISHTDDSTGERLVLLTTLVTLIAIAAGAFIYWRADRALAATRPRSAGASAQREVAAVAAPPLPLGDIELTEWDSWPERDAEKQEESDGEEAELEAPASFEPEVAVEPAQDAEPKRVDSGIDTEEAVAEVVEDQPETADPESPVEANVEPLPDLPSNVFPFRLPASVASSEPENTNVAPIAEAVDVAETEEAVVDADEEQDVEVDEPDMPTIAAAEDPALHEPESNDEQETRDVPKAKAEPEPTTFESSLLAGIDGSQVAENGGYRSPLLSDLGSDQLEGVGLAKWRPDAQLTERPEETDTPPPAKRRFRG